MTEQEKELLLDELEKRIEKKYKGCLSREDTASVLKEVREKWFSYDSLRGPESPMHKLFGNIIFWQVWEHIRKLTCVICGCQYVRHLSGIKGAEEVAEKLCQAIYDIKSEYDRDLYEREILEAKARNEANGVFFPLLEEEEL